MPTAKNYQHFCMAARSLDVVGEKWSLLIVRDLLREPQRFTDLLRYLNDITPKGLTTRLRDLEAEGIVERDTQEGRREVWYHLTDKGRDLGPVLRELVMWGAKYARRPPLPEEVVHPEHLMNGLAAFLNANEINAPDTTAWAFHFGDGDPFTVQFSDGSWTVHRKSQDANVVIETTPRAWATYVMGSPAERRAIKGDVKISGSERRVDEFLDFLKRRDQLLVHED